MLSPSKDSAKLTPKHIRNNPMEMGSPMHIGFFGEPHWIITDINFFV